MAAGTWYHVYPEPSTGPSRITSSVPSGNTGSYLMESALTRGSERTRRRSDTVSAIASRWSPPGAIDGPSDGCDDDSDVACGALVTVVGWASGVGDIAVPQPARSIARQ